MDGVPLWMLGVVGHDDGSTATVVVQPKNEQLYDQLVTRVRRGGWTRVSAAEWQRTAWPTAPAGAVDVVAGELVRITTGKASVYASESLDVTPMWTSAARERRALVAVCPPNRAIEGLDPDEVGELLAQLANERQLYAALCQVRFDVFTGQRPAM